MPRPTWPREYLLRIYNAAVEHGHVVLTPISEEDAISLTQTLYRLRRADRATEQFITPEMHLVTCGQWRFENGRGFLPIYYNTVPDTEPALPSIIPVAGSPIAALAPESDDVLPTDLLLAADSAESEVAMDVPLSPDEIDDFVSDLVRKAQKRKKSDDPEV